MQGTFSAGRSAKTIYVIDDDDFMLEAIKDMLGSLGAEVQLFDSPVTFLQRYSPRPVECVISDIVMPELSGLEMQKKLVQTHLVPPPIVFLTGVSEIAAVVEAMRSGAFDFIEKPVNGYTLVERVNAALAESVSLHSKRLALAARQARIALLTSKEAEIVELVVAGKPSREISEAQGISIRTVENHRARIMAKLHVTSTVELVRLFL
ncbi:response regulator transcription factor [Jeongeupia naejangsanensis]|uniref:Response regulator transcription factor n=1 Tax=Jeongeupia naejangsanensis TaxID=613195 RepID=A0ABS2BGI7_9NEIS|nr:response regulator [Jeongeupia naejangsanensis]MBM3114723.1 response regulator transcription factor [Jeongeupia naejangsanensis]